MSLKKKLFTTISMFCLTIAMLMVGVWAVSSDQVSFGGTITFTATNILATISGEVSGTASDPTLDDLEYTSAGGPSTTALNSWSNNLTFKEDGSAFSIEITIKNDSSRKIYWSITDTVASNANISKTISTYTLGETNELDGNGTTTFTITIGLANGTNNSVSGSYGYQIDLCDESEYVPPVDITNGHTYLTFGTPDTSNNTISVTNCAAGTVDAIIPANVIIDGQPYKVTSIADGNPIRERGVFSSAGSTLNSVNLPATLTSIGEYAFKGCSSLTSITISDSVTSIGANAFSYCSGLTSITIGNSVKSIGNYAFSYCSGLTSIIIPDSVETIGDYAFDSCSSLTSVTIGNGVTSIGLNAFSSCTSLTDVYYKGNETQWNVISIDKGNTPLTNATKHYNYTGA